MILINLAVAAPVFRHVRPVQDRRQVDPLRLPMLDRLLHLQPIGSTDHLVHGAEPELRHVFAQLLGDEAHEVDDMLGIACELRPQFRILGGNAHRTGVQVADPHHDAAQGDQRAGGETEFLGAQQRCDGQVAARLQLAVGLDNDATAQIVDQQGLMCFGHAQFPRQAGMFDARLRGRPRAAVVAADQNDIGMALGDPCRDRAHAHLRHQLHVDAGVVVGVLEVVDQLRQIFDRVDVMVRRRRDQADPGRGVPHLGNPGIHLFAGQLPPFARLGSLCHLDLQLPGVDEIVACHAKAGGCHLLDGTVLGVAVRLQDVAGRVFPALAGIAAPADAVHGDRQRLVRLLADRAVGHGSGLEASADRLHRLHLFDGYARCAVQVKLQQTAQVAPFPVHEVDVLRVGLERGVILGSNRLLQQVHRARVEQVQFAVLAPLVVASGCQQLAFPVPCPVFGHTGRTAIHLIRCKEAHGIGAVVAHLDFGAYLRQVDPLDPARGPGKVLVDHMLAETERLENLCAAITLDRRNAHLGHHFDDTLDRSLDVVVDRRVVVDPHQQPILNHLGQRFHRQIRVDGRRAVANQQGQVMHLARFAGFDHQRHPRARLVANQIVVQSGGCQQRRDRRRAGANAPVRKDEDVDAFVNGLRRRLEQILECLLQRRLPTVDVKEHRKGPGAEFLYTAVSDVADLGQLAVGQDRVAQLELTAILRLGFKQVQLRAQHHFGARNQFFADGIDGRIGHLGKKLLEVVVQQL